MHRNTHQRNAAAGSTIFMTSIPAVPGMHGASRVVVGHVLKLVTEVPVCVVVCWPAGAMVYTAAQAIPKIIMAA